MVMGSLRQSTEVAIIGAGPGGYVAALRLADLGKEVTLIEARERPGGTCLLEGCIPSKAYIHAVELIESAKQAEKIGLTFGQPKIDVDALRRWTGSVVDTLVSGINGLLKRRDIELVHAHARFDGPTSLALEGAEVSGIDFKQCIVATGSSINVLPAAYDKPVWSSADALLLPRIPPRLLVVGGGYIGLELGLVYAGLGSAVTVCEFLPQLLMGADLDLVEIMVKQVAKRFSAILYGSRVVGVNHQNGLFDVEIEHAGQRSHHEFDQVLVAVGRQPNTNGLGLAEIGVEVDSRGFVVTDSQCRTRVPNIYAIGDVTHGPMLAHKASREAKVVAEVIAEQPSAFDNRGIPAVVYTDPEIAWVGLTEREAAATQRPVTIGRFPLSALGRARTLGRTDGMAKVIADPTTQRVLGVGMVGPQAIELIAEGTLALEMGATLEDLLATIHPHPTLSEAILEAAEVAAGMPVHINPPRR